jgi:hypothetical protein
MFPISIEHLYHNLDFISSLCSSSSFLARDSEVGATAFAIDPF